MCRLFALIMVAGVTLAGSAAQGQEGAIGEVYGKGVHAYFARNYAEAHRYLSEAIQAGSQDPRAFYFRGLSLMQLGREPDAKLDFSQGTKLEVAGLDQFSEISRSLERVQGSPRRTLETYRSGARMAVVASREQQRVQRFEVVQAQPDAGTPATPAPTATATAAPANPFGPAKPEAVANPFAKTEAPAAAPAAPAAAMPAGANPFAKTETPAAPATPAPTTPATPAPTTPATPATPAATPAAASTAIVIPDTPDGTVQTIINEILNDKPQVVWQALPAKYQDDIKGVIADFGAKMDQELWDKVFGVLGKGLNVAKEKKDFILAYPAIANSPAGANKDALLQSWDAQVAPLETLLTSDLATLEGLKMLDPDKFLSGTLATMMKQVGEADEASGQPQVAALKEMGKMIKVTVVSADADVATISIEVPGQEPMEHMLKKVDGKWLPAAMADGWDEGIASAKAAIEMMDFAAITPQVMPVLTTIEGAADAMLAAETQESFSMVIDNIMAVVGPMIGPLLPQKAASLDTLSMSKLHQVGLAMDLYEIQKSHMPAPAIADKDGKPLLSWRVELLPLLEEQQLYDEFHRDEPWDSEHNMKLIAKMPQVFASKDNPELTTEGKTRFVVPTGAAALFKDANGPAKTAITDGTRNTIRAVEVALEQAVIWTKPDDLTIDPANPWAGLKGSRPSGFIAAFADGSARFVSEKVDDETLGLLFNPTDGKPIDDAKLNPE